MIPFFIVYSSTITVNYLDTKDSSNCSRRHFNSSRTVAHMYSDLCDHTTSVSSIGISGINSFLVHIFASLRWLASLVFFSVFKWYLFKYRISAGRLETNFAYQGKVRICVIDHHRYSYRQPNMNLEGTVSRLPLRLLPNGTSPVRYEPHLAKWVLLLLRAPNDRIIY